MGKEGVEAGDVPIAPLLRPGKNRGSPRGRLPALGRQAGAEYYECGQARVPEVAMYAQCVLCLLSEGSAFL